MINAESATGESSADIGAQIRAALAGYEPGTATMLGVGTDDIDAAREYLSRLAPGGWVVPRWPNEYGGRAGDSRQARAIAAYLRDLSPPDLYPFQVGLALVGPALLRHGSPQQCARWLPAIARGDAVWCQLFSEPGAGSDLAGLSCRADRVEGGWRLTGQKVWSSRAAYADLGIALARFDPALPKHAGIVALVVDMHAEGVTVRPLRQMNGDSHFSEVFLDGVFVPESDRVAEPGDGWAVARTILGLERATFGSEGSGTGTGMRRQLLELARRTDDPVRRDQVIHVWCDMEVARLAGKRAGELAASGQDATAAAAGAKLRMGRNLRAAAELAIGLLGMDGLEPGTFFSDLLLTAPSLSIRGGTDEVQRSTIGEQLLGLPREPRADGGPFNAPRVAEGSRA